MKLLTDRAQVVCKHEIGRVGLEASQSLVFVDGQALLVDSDPEGRPIRFCPNYGVGIKPCQRTLKVKVGYSGLLRIEGRRVALDSVRGLTDGTPPGIVEYLVRRPGQDLLAERP
ncbi:hypothetical protein QR90_08375 [Deinococcus radiopugnans]|uniref:Uncharacterized protein n=1 Tax=Deinococcus radiopugnans TaxID=57497 RepID=A0A0A7KG11_9DEIO|nr:hypothetical protein [Deinococcus radiopugnans]AIZ45117.1 hypothetical protein QR90_08375 [Deinococcus radiopugnans]